MRADEVILRFDELDPEPANVWDLTAQERAVVRDLFQPLGRLLLMLEQAGQEDAP